MMTQLMHFFWFLEDLTHLPPFGWVGNWIENNFRHELSPELIASIKEGREEWLVLRTPEEIDAFVDSL